MLASSFVCFKRQALRLGNGWGPVIWNSNIDKQPGNQGRTQGPSCDNSSTSLGSGVMAASLNSSTRLHPSSGSVATTPQQQDSRSLGSEEIRGANSQLLQVEFGYCKRLNSVFLTCRNFADNFLVLILDSGKFLL